MHPNEEYCSTVVGRPIGLIHLSLPALASHQDVALGKQHVEDRTVHLPEHSVRVGDNKIDEMHYTSSKGSRSTTHLC